MTSTIPPPKFKPKQAIHPSMAHQLRPLLLRSLQTVLLYLPILLHLYNTHLDLRSWLSAQSHFRGPLRDFVPPNYRKDWWYYTVPSPSSPNGFQQLRKPETALGLLIPACVYTSILACLAEWLGGSWFMRPHHHAGRKLGPWERGMSIVVTPACLVIDMVFGAVLIARGLRWVGIAGEYPCTGRGIVKNWNPKKGEVGTFVPWEQVPVQEVEGGGPKGALMWSFETEKGRKMWCQGWKLEIGVEVLAGCLLLLSAVGTLWLVWRQRNLKMPSEEEEEHEEQMEGERVRANGEWGVFVNSVDVDADGKRENEMGTAVVKERMARKEGDLIQLYSDAA